MFDPLQIYKDLLTPSEIDYARDCYNNNDTVNYNKMNLFINDVLKKIEQENNWDGIQYTKYRVSNNNNSTDAAILHRDIISYVEEENLPIYTCVIYLDVTTMELLPESHKKTSFGGILSSFSN